MTQSATEWTDRTWNPVRGCARVSPGCERCYAERQAHRFSGASQPYEGLTVLGKHGPRWRGEARFIPSMLDAPLKWREPQRIFVNSMSDLWHQDITNEQIAAVFGVMAACPKHTFQVLTKRPDRMNQWFAWHEKLVRDREWRNERWRLCENEALECLGELLPASGCLAKWPLRNVHIGVSCEDQQRAAERIPLLLETPAAIRFVSAEPLLGELDLEHFMEAECWGDCNCDYLYGYEPGCRRNGGDGYLTRKLDWVIVGGESGPGARPCNVDWIRSIVKQCADAGTPCFVKQLGAAPFVLDVDEAAAVETFPRLKLGDRKGGEMSEWPEPLRVRQFPEVTT
jgi:protein gp37